MVIFRHMSIIYIHKYNIIKLEFQYIACVNYYESPRYIFVHDLGWTCNIESRHIWVFSIHMCKSFFVLQQIRGDNMPMCESDAMCYWYTDINKLLYSMNIGDNVTVYDYEVPSVIEKKWPGL